MTTKGVIPGRPKALWFNRDYMLLWGGQIASSIGTQVSQLAFPLFILSLTGSAAQAGFAGALRALPYVIFSLPAGALIDRWDRKRTMILCAWLWHHPLIRIIDTLLSQAWFKGT